MAVTPAAEASVERHRPVNRFCWDCAIAPMAAKKKSNLSGAGFWILSIRRYPRQCNDRMFQIAEFPERTAAGSVLNVIQFALV
jgi:hypothetical protein